MRLASLYFKMHTLPFKWRKDCTFHSGQIVMETHSSEHCLTMPEQLIVGQGLERGIAHEKRTQLKEKDPPYRLMTVLASVLSDQLSCWLHHRVKMEWQINYRSEANLLFLSQRAAVCFPSLLSLLQQCWNVSCSTSMLTVYSSIYTNVLKRKYTVYGEGKNMSIYSGRMSQKLFQTSRKESGSVISVILFHRFKIVPLKVN